MDWSHKEWFWHGTARFASPEDLQAAGMLQFTLTSIFLGFFGGLPIWYAAAGGLLLIAGARSGKLRDILAYNICSGICTSATMLILDLKGELAAISRNQAPDRKHCYYWNPAALHGLLQHRINPVDYLRWSSPTLFSDVKVFIEQLIPLSGSANAVYFELNGRRILEAICITLTKVNGVLTLPDLYRAVTALPEDGKVWRDVAWEMYISGIELCRSVEAEIHAAREDSSGGFKGIIGELQKAVACLTDPLLREAVSPPYDFSLADLCKEDQPVQFYLMCPAELVSIWAPVIKSIFTGAMIYKARAPQAPQQTWILDECAQLVGFDLVPKMFSYGAGIGIRPWAIFQTEAQMDALGKNARAVITASASVRSYFGVREWESARRVSDMLGVETLDYYDFANQGRADLDARTLLQTVLSGEDAFRAAPKLHRLIEETTIRGRQRRLLQTPDEVLNMAPGRQVIFADGLPGAIYAERAPYWEQRFMAGRYHPNPYHPPLDRVLVQGRFRKYWRPVITGSVPECFRDYPQYRNGLWSYIGG
jgi:type IV secretion system protein VirD4